MKVEDVRDEGRRGEGEGTLDEKRYEGGREKRIRWKRRGMKREEEWVGRVWGKW